MRLPSRPAAALLGIDGYPYVSEPDGLRRLTLDEQAALERRPDTAALGNGAWAIASTAHAPSRLDPPDGSR